MNKTLPLIAALAGSMLLAACGGGSGSSQLKISVADAPIDGAEKVVVTFTGVEVKPVGGDAIQLDLLAPVQVDLLATAGGQAAVVVAPSDVPSGDYEWMRLKVVTNRDTLDSYIQLAGGEQAPLFVPSGEQSGLKIIHAFSVPDSGLQALTVDFDLRRSITKPVGQNAYTLKPVLRVVADDAVGLISGNIDPTLYQTEDCTADPLTGAGGSVYVYTGADAMADDIGGAGTQPLLTAPVKAVVVDSVTTYTYTVAYLPAASYTVAFSCQAGDDALTTDEAILFPAQGNVAVTAGATAVLNLPNLP